MSESRVDESELTEAERALTDELHDLLVKHKDVPGVSVAMILSGFLSATCATNQLPLAECIEAAVDSFSLAYGVKIHGTVPKHVRRRGSVH